MSRPLPPAAALRHAERMLERLEGDPARLGDSCVVEGWWIETHTIGCRNHADTPEDDWWDEHWQIHDEYAGDGRSTVLGDAADGIFATLTPADTDVSP